MVNGKRVKTIDVHSHRLFHEAANLMGDAGAKALAPPINNSAEAWLAVEERIAAMNRQAIDLEVLSINPFWYKSDRDLAKKIVSIQNEKLAELVASKPDRFAAFASLTMQDPALAVNQLETAMKKQRLKGNGWLSNTAGNPLATTIALQHLICDGSFDKFPGLKVLAAHGGGYLGSYAPRSDHAHFVAKTFLYPNIGLKKKPAEYLNQIFFDPLIFTPQALRHLVARVGSSQIMLGSDYPYQWELHPVDHVFATKTLSHTEIDLTRQQAVDHRAGAAQRCPGGHQRCQTQPAGMLFHPFFVLHNHQRQVKQANVPHNTNSRRPAPRATPEGRHCQQTQSKAPPAHVYPPVVATWLTTKAKSRHRGRCHPGRSRPILPPGLQLHRRLPLTRIPILHEDDPATPANAKAYLQEALQARGRLVNIYRAMANRPEAGRAFSQLANTVYRGTTTLDPKHAELAYLTATVVNNCYY